MPSFFLGLLFRDSFLPSIASRFKLYQVSWFSISRNKSAGSCDRCSPGSLLGFLLLSSCRSQTNRQIDRYTDRQCERGRSLPKLCVSNLAGPCEGDLLEVSSRLPRSLEKSSLSFCVFFLSDFPPSYRRSCFNLLLTKRACVWFWPYLKRFATTPRNFRNALIWTLYTVSNTQTSSGPWALPFFFVVWGTFACP